MRPDQYSCFRDLSSSESSQAYRIECKDRGSSVAVVAPHAGRIEVGTSEIARAIADCALSFYLFEGLKSSANADRHITSSRFDEPIALSLAEVSQMVLTVHGQAGSESFVNVGGGHQTLCGILRDLLNDAGFSVISPQSSALQGLDPKNICNRGTLGMGVQLELSRGLRTQLLSDSKSLSFLRILFEKPVVYRGFNVDVLGFIGYNTAFLIE